MSSDLVSIIVPTLNKEVWIKGLLRNIHAQTYRPVEVLVVDGGSTDGTIENVRQLSLQLSSENFRIDLISERDFGSLRTAGNAKNIGVRTAKGSKIVFLDPDMRFLQEDNLDDLAAQLDSHPFVQVKTHFLLDTDLERSLAKFHPASHHCGYRREIFDNINFNPVLGYGEDKDFWYRAQRDLGLGMNYVCDVTIGRHLPHTKTEYLHQTLWYARTMPAFISNAAKEGEERYLEEASVWLMYWAYALLIAGVIPLAFKDCVLKKGVDHSFRFLLWDYLVRRFSSAVQFSLSALNQHSLTLPAFLLVRSLRKRFFTTTSRHSTDWD
jgi:glycosyltransferase involved in cell wall biosynthesis